jgi:hypothetical protein
MFGQQNYNFHNHLVLPPSKMTFGLTWQCLKKSRFDMNKYSHYPEVPISTVIENSRRKNNMKKGTKTVKHKYHINPINWKQPFQRSTRWSWNWVKIPTLSRNHLIFHNNKSFKFQKLLDEVQPSRRVQSTFERNNTLNLPRALKFHPTLYIARITKR